MTSVLSGIMLLSTLAFAQNSDLALMGGGAIPSSSSQINGATITSSESGGLSYQVAYAFQIHGWSKGDLHIEIPFAGVTGPASSKISPGNVTGSAGAVLFLTPGVRYKVAVSPRVSLYAAAGFGVGWFLTEQGSVGPVVSGTSTVAAHPVVDFAGGLDFRLTRLLSLRGEVRDFVSGGGFAGNAGRNHPIFQGGIGFHF